MKEKTCAIDRVYILMAGMVHIYKRSMYNRKFASNKLGIMEFVVGSIFIF